MLDTDTWRALVKRQPRELIKRLRPDAVGDAGISATTRAELPHGVARGAYAAQTRAALVPCSIPLDIAAFDDLAADGYGTVRAALETGGAPIGAPDTLIAGHAVSLSAVLGTYAWPNVGRSRACVPKKGSRHERADGRGPGDCDCGIALMKTASRRRCEPECAIRGVGRRFVVRRGVDEIREPHTEGEALCGRVWRAEPSHPGNGFVETAKDAPARGDADDCRAHGLDLGHDARGRHAEGEQ